MFDILQQWYHRHFTDSQTVIFAFILIVGTALILLLNTHLMPILVAIIIAYLAEGLVTLMHRYEESRDMIEVGAYKSGQNPELDRAIEFSARFHDLMKQKNHSKTKESNNSKITVCLYLALIISSISSWHIRQQS